MNDGYYRYPTLSGDRVAFVCEDDVWTAPLAGGTAARLTVTPGICSTPRFSPDGTQLAFVATDEGNPEVYVMPAAGGTPRRLTFLGATIALVNGWTADGREILFVANPETWYERETRAFAVDRTGRVRELRLGHMRAISFGRSGAVAIGRNADDPARWKRYRGGTSGEIWLDPSGEGEFDRLRLPDGNPVWPMLDAERLYFLSDHEGIGNIYSCALDASDVRRHTHHGDYYVRFPSSDGRRIVYGAGASLYWYDMESGRTAAIDIATPSAAPQRARRFENGSETLDEFAPSPDGTGIGAIARGQAITMPFWEQAPIPHEGSSAVRRRCFAWMHDGERFVCTSDGDGFERVELHRADGSAQPELLTDGDVGRIDEMVCSPVKEQVAIANHRYELLLLDARDKSLRVLDKSLGSRIADLAFSPDGRYLAYVWYPGPDNAAIVRIVRLKSGEIHDVTPRMRVDQSPAWDPQGRYLYFISTRDFDPVYDALQFDLSFPQAQRPFLLTLRPDVPNPFAPKPRPVHRDRDHDREHEEASKKKDERPPRVEIDFEGIEGRILAFPVEEGEYGRLVAVKNRVLYTKFEVRGIKTGQSSRDDRDASGTLLAYDFEQQRAATLATDVSEIALSLDAHTLVYRSQDRLRAVDALGELPDEHDDQKPPNEPGRKSGWIDLDRISVEIDPAAEWKQMYHEAWRLQTEQFWVEDMSDIDWDLVRDRYAALLPKVRTRAELSDLIWEMHGELGTSHAYEMGGDLRQPPQYKRGFLGADYEYDEASGGWIVARILRGDSWNRDADSPLAEPGLDIAPGDVLVAIAGKTLSRERTPNQALVNAAGRDVPIVLRRGGAERRVTVKVLAGEQALRYRAWVDAQRKTVHGATGGRVGYVHIPDMGPWGFSEFHRGYLSEFDRGALIVDVRYNRGGHVSPLLLEKLARKRVGYDVSRYSLKPIPYPPESAAGPLVAITNQFAGSDGDIFSHCFKMYGLGPLVGKRTWGGVIGINPVHRLVDGTVTTQPEFSFWFKDVGWKVENYGTDPDYDVDIAPHDYREGKDPQLEFAIRLAGSALASFEEALPDLSSRPSLPLPTLP